MVFNRRRSNLCYGIRKLAIGVVSMVISVAFLTEISVAQAKENTSNYQEHLVDKKASVADLTKTREKSKNQVESFRPLNQQDMIKLAKGQLTLPGGQVDPSFYHEPVLDVAGDDDHDGKNGQELYVEKVNNREFLGYHTHPLLSDSDGDGLLDADEIKNHTDPLVWNICDRDLAMMMELSYRDDNYIQQVLDSHHPLKEKYNGRQEYELMHTELAPFWKAEKSFHESDGLDATFFVTHSDLPYLKDNQVQVLAIRGTKGGADLDDDLNLTLGMTPGQVDSLNKILKQLQNEGALTNTYLTGHSLGGYLAMTALVEARDKGYTGIKKAVTFNAPKIRGNLFNKKMQRVAKEANLLTQRGEAIHYAVSNDNVISAVGNFIGAKSVGKSANGHSSRTYFEDRIMQFGFKQGRRKSSMAGTGDQEANLKKVLAGFSNPVVVTQADAYPAKIKNHIVTEVGVIPDLTQCILNRNELPLAKVEDKTSSMHLYQPYQIGKGQCGSLSLTYQDGSKKTYFVTIDVQKAKPAGVITSQVDPLVQKANPAGVVTSKVDPIVQKAKPAGVVTSKGEPLVQKAKPEGVVTSKVDPLVQKAKPAGVVTSKVDPLVQKAKPAGVVTSKGDPLVQKVNPAGVVTSKGDPLVQKAKPAGVITSQVDPLVQKANPAGVVTSKGEPLVQKAKPAGVVTSKGEPLVQKAKPAGVITSKGEPLVQKAKPEGVVTSKVDPLVQKAKPAGVITSQVDPLVQKAKPAGVVTSKGEPLLQKANPAGVVISKGEPLVQETKPAGVVTSKVDPLVQKAKPAGVVTSKVDPLVQKAKPAAVITSKVDPLVQKATPAGVVTSKGDPLVELTKADHATELSHLTELLEKKVPSIKQKQLSQQISSDVHINAKKLPQLGADCRILVYLVSFMSIFIIGSSKYVINKDKK